MVIAIVVLIILTAIFMSSSNGVLNEAAYARFVSEIYQVQNGVYNARVENASEGDTEERINANFTKVSLKNAPEEFESFDTIGGKVTGYSIDLKYLKYDDADYGKRYSADKKEIEFDKDDVYVYDATGSVYYARGIYYEKNDEVVYSIANIADASLKSTDDGPIITSITVSSGELDDGTKTNAKAKITIAATPRNGGALTVMVRNTIATKQPNGTFVTQVSRNGTYTVLVTEENGGRTVSKAVVTGILESTLPPTNLSMLINGGAAYTTDPLVDITVRADGASYKMITKNPLRPNKDDTRWEKYETNFEYNLGTEEGRITLYAWFKDEFGNVTEQIVKASITYDASAPSTDKPTVSLTGPYALLECNQRDSATPQNELQILYGYRLSDGKTGQESDFIWSTSKLIGPLDNKKTYDFVTKATDDAGNSTISKHTTVYISYDYTIKFDLQGGTGEFPDMYTEEGEAITLPESMPQKQGYDFVGWSENKDASPNSSVDIVHAGGSYTPVGTMVVKTLYAIYKARLDTPYKVIHFVELPGTLGDYEEVLKEELVGETDQDAYALPKTEGEFAYYTENVNHRDRLVMDKIRADGTTVLKIYYTRRKFTLTLKGDHGTLTPRVQEVGYGMETTISVIPDDGYAFNEWQIEGAASNSPEYDNFTGENGNKAASAKFKMPGHDVVLNATFTVRGYTITYELKHGTVSSANPESYTRNTAKFTLNNPVKAGYDFAGWTGTDLTAPTLEVTLDPAKLEKMGDRTYVATYAPTDDLLTMSKNTEENTNDPVKVTITCLDSNLTIEYKIGEGGSWTTYTGGEIEISENCTVYARALEDGVVVDEENIIINNIDREPPKITNVEVANTWTAGNALTLKITATDNVKVTAYGITASENRPSDGSFVSTEDCKGVLPYARDGVNYVWAKDGAGNVARKIVKIWDVSKNIDKKVFAFMPSDTEFFLVGTGETKAYGKENIPYKNEKSQITSVKVGEGITSLNDHILSEMKNAKEISLPKTLAEITEDALIYTNHFEKIEVAKGNTHFVYQNYTLLDNSKQTIYIHSAEDPAPTYTIPSTVKEIRKLAFYENTYLEKVVTTSNPKVNAYAFEGCTNLKEIDGQIGGNKIAEGAFKDCEELNKIVLSSTLTEIGDRAFYNTKKIGNMIIPKTVQTVGGSLNEVFKNIGIASQNGEEKGVVRYYASSLGMNAYAQRFADEAIFMLIDDQGPILNSLKVMSPASGVYPAGTVVTIVATFDENISTETLTLTLKVGDGVNRIIRSGKVEANTITYTYVSAPEDKGEVTLVSYVGTASDAIGNVSNIHTVEMTGALVTINTVVKLEEGEKTWYFAKLQDAINYAKISPIMPSKITLLASLTESAVIANNKDIEINLNGKTLTAEAGSVGIQNDGKLSIIGAGKVVAEDKACIMSNEDATTTIEGAEIISNSESNTPAIVNSSTMNISNSKITGKEIAISNTGTATLKNSEVKAERIIAIENRTGTLNISGGEVKIENGTGNTAIKVGESAKAILMEVKVTAEEGLAIENKGSTEISGTTKILAGRGITNSENATLRVYGGEIENTAEGGTLIENHGDAMVSGGSYISHSTNEVMKNYAGATFTIDGGTIKAANEETGNVAIQNAGTLTISKNAEITSLKNTAIANGMAGTALIEGGVMSGAGNATISNQGQMTIEGATINAKGKMAIDNSGNADLAIHQAEITLNASEETVEVIGINLNTNKVVSMDEVTLVVSANAETTVGIKVNTGATFNTNKLEVKVTSEGTGYALYNGGTVTLGADDATIHQNIKLDGSDYGYYGEDTSTLNFYDGMMIGKEEKSIHGPITKQPEKSFIKKTVDSARETSILVRDDQAPEVTLTASIDGWTTSDVTVTGIATDNGSGIVAYALNSTQDVVLESEWQLVQNTARLEITETITETKTLYLHVRDLLGNTSVSQKVEVRIDKEAPVITNVSLEKDGWVTPNAVIRVNATDGISGICAYEFTNTYRDVTAPGNYTEIAPTKTFDRTIPTGNAHWYIYVKDCAGNTAYEHFVVRNVDAVLPVITVSENTHTQYETEIKIEVTEAESGIESITVNGTEIDFEESITKENTVQGVYTINKAGVYIIKATDKAGNVATKVLNAYLLSYVANGGTGADVTRVKVEGIPVQIIENAFGREGYAFAHWNTKIDDTGDTYVPGQTFEANESTVFFAIWGDQTPPVILDVVLSEYHVSGQNPMLHIIATDNEKVTGYAITKSSQEPSTWSTVPDVTVSDGDGVYYVWAKDNEGNVTVAVIKLYDISRNDNPKSVFAIQKTDVEDENKIILSIEGEGRTKDFTKDTLPWKEDLDKITNVEVKRGIERLGREVLGHLENVNEIILSDSILNVEIDTFIHSTHVEEIIVQGSNFVYQNGMLLDKEKETLYLASATGAGEQVTIPDTVKEIAPYAFENSNARQVSITQNIDLPEGAFKNAVFLEKIEAPYGIGGKKIGTSAFEGCVNLETVKISERLESIGDKAFYNTISLTEITIPKTVTTLEGKEIFTNTSADVYYYWSCGAMRNYAWDDAETKDQANFIPIDDIPPTDDAPTARSSTSTVVVTCNQRDLETGIAKTEYIIRKEGEEYNDRDWQEENYFTGLLAETNYYVKTRVTDRGGNVTESYETLIITKKVPDQIELTLTPSGPTSGDVTVIIEWPQSAIDNLYGEDWPSGTSVTKQIGVKKSGDAGITWIDADSAEAISHQLVEENDTTVYARLFDGRNYTQQVISITVTNIDKIPPSGSVLINEDQETTSFQDVKLKLTATDNRTETGYGVKYYYASELPEPPVGDVSLGIWQDFNGDGEYDYKLTYDTGIKTVYVWYMDAAGNVSEACSDRIELIRWAVRLDQGGKTTFYETLMEGIEKVSTNTPEVPSKLTLLKNIRDEYPLEIVDPKNVILDMNGYIITVTEEGTANGFYNNGVFEIINSQPDKETQIIVAVENGDAYGIYNNGLLKVDGVSVEARAPNGKAIGIYNYRNDFAVKLEENGVTTFYRTLGAAVDVASHEEPEQASVITLLRDITNERDVTIAETQNIILDLGGFNLTIETRVESSLITNNGKLRIQNTARTESKMEISVIVGNAYGVYNTGYTEVNHVEIIAKAPNGIGVGVYNQRKDYVARLVEGDFIDYYISLQEAFDEAKNNNPSEKSEITLLRDIKKEEDLMTFEGQNILLDMNGYKIRVEPEESDRILTNHATLVITNQNADAPSTMTLNAENGDVIGIYNTGYVELSKVTLDVKSNNGTAIAIQNAH